MEMMRMQRSTVLTAFHRAATLFLAASMVPAGWAQDASSVPSAPSAQMPAQQAVPSKSQPFEVKEYSKPRSAFPNLLAPYTARHVAPPNLANTPRIDQLMRDGKLYISMNDAVALALENNLDIAIARYNLNIADTDVWRAKAGSSTLGVNNGVVQNTPGGGVGGLGTQVGSGQGGTSVGAGGAGAGSGGLVQSTLGSGPQITSFDPILSGTLQIDHLKIACATPFCGNVQNTGTASFAYAQGFQWGTNMSVSFNNQRQTTNSQFTNVSPGLNSSFKFQLTQHLLQGFGFAANTRFIQIAKNDRELSDVAFRLQIITTVDQIENMYWDLVFAYENVRVQQESLTYGQKAYDDAKRQAQVGTIPPIQVVSAQSTVATDQQNLIVAQNNLELQQLLMKNALSRSIEDPVLAGADVIPTSTMLIPQQEPATSTLELIAEALHQRAELTESSIDLDTRNLNNKTVRNAMLPTLDAFAYYGGSGVGGDVARPTCSSTILSDCFNPKNAAPPFVNGGPVSYPSTLQQLVNGTAPDKGVGLTLNIPLRNRQAQANQVRAQLEYRQAQVRQHQLENQVRIEVRNAQFDVKQNRAAVQAAQSAAEFARESLNSDQQKLKVGLTTQVTILQDAATLTTGESNLVSAKAA